MCKWFISATPIISSMRDLEVPLALLWNSDWAMDLKHYVLYRLPRAVSNDDDNDDGEKVMDLKELK